MCIYSFQAEISLSKFESGIFFFYHLIRDIDFLNLHISTIFGYEKPGKKT